MSSSANPGNSEILQIADSVAREKGILRESVIEAMESAIAIAGKRKYGHDHNIKAEINKKTGEIKLFREMLIVSEVENTIAEISLEDARERDPELNIGDAVFDLLPPIDLGRVSAQAAKQVIVQKVRDAERERQYEDFKDRVGEIINGVVKRMEYGNVILDLGRSEAIIRRDSLIRSEVFRQNDRIRAYIEDVRREAKGPQIFLSRTCNEFLAKLFSQEVPEIYDNVIQIKAVAREPGSRAKMAVYSSDPSIDPVGSCVGVRGSRVQAVIAELKGEKIDIIEWSSDPATFVVNALAPAEASKVVIDEERNRIEVVLPSDQLSLAIGRRGQNVRLASQLTGWNIDVLTEDEESKRRVEEFTSVTLLFMKALDVEEVLAQLLAVEGFASIEEVAYVALEDLTSIEGFDEGLAAEIQLRANNYLDLENNDFNLKVKALAAAPRVAKILLNKRPVLEKLINNNIVSLQDLADLSHDEFVDIVQDSGMSDEDINTVIMAAREYTTPA
jgi:N utilization substance protein A